MKILHIGNGNLKSKGNYYYNIIQKMNNGLVRNGHNVLFLSDRDIARASGLFGIKDLGIKKARSIIIETAINFKPDLIFLDAANFLIDVDFETLQEKLPNTKLLIWSNDAVFVLKIIQQLEKVKKYADAIFLTTGGEVLKKFSTKNNIVSYIPNISDASIDNLSCFENESPLCDVFFAARGVLNYKVDNPRYKYPHHIEQQRDIKACIKLFGKKGMFMGCDFYEQIGNSAMGLNISHDHDYVARKKATLAEKYLYSSDRIAVYMGNGLLTFTTNDNALENLYAPNEEIIIFDDEVDLIEKIRFYKKNNNERMHIAKNGWRRAHEDFNERIVTKYMVEATMCVGGIDTTDSDHYKWPTKKY